MIDSYLLVHLRKVVVASVLGLEVGRVRLHLGRNIVDLVGGGHLRKR
jgi:hypothetical protein